MQRIFFFEKIGYFYFPFLVFLRIFFPWIKIYFRNSNNFFKKKNFYLLRKIGFIYINYCNLNFDKYVKDFCKDNILATKKIFEKISQTEIYFSIKNHYKIMPNDEKILEIVLSKAIAGNYLNEGVNTLNLIKYKFNLDNLKIFYFPETLGNYLIVKNENIKNIVPIKILIYLKNLIIFFIGILKFENFPKKKNYKILYCPNDGLKFGNAFKKNFIFQNNYKKKFRPSDIVVLDFSKKNKLLNRYLKLIRSKLDIFPDLKNYSLFKFIFFLNKSKLCLFKNSEYFFFLFSVFNQIEIFLKFLDKYPKLKCAIFHYDINANINLIFACHVKKIRTLSFQERSSSYTYTPYMYFDEYYISGKKIKNLFSKNFYFFKKIKISALPRTKLLNNNFSTNYYLENKKFLKKKVILCLDLPFLDFHTRANYGNICSDYARNNFYNLVINLSKIHKNYYFVIKPKFINNNDSLIKKFIKKLKKNNIDNVRLITKNNFNIYKFASISDLLFGNYSSIFDEFFSVNKKILIFDKNLKYFNHPFSQSDLTCDNYDDVLIKFSNIFKFENARIKKLRNDYFLYKQKNMYTDIITTINKLV